MSTAGISTRTQQTSPRLGSRFIGMYYLLTVATGLFILFFHGRLALIADVVVGIAYLALTALLYGWSAARNSATSTATRRHER